MSREARARRKRQVFFSHTWHTAGLWKFLSLSLQLSVLADPFSNVHSVASNPGSIDPYSAGLMTF